jgi:hypothetical protein
MHTTTLILGLYLVWIKLFNIIIYHNVACNLTCQKWTTSIFNLTRDEINRFNIKITTLEYTTSRIIVMYKTCSPYLPRAWISASMLALACASNRLWQTWVEKMFGIRWKVCSICVNKNIHYWQFSKSTLWFYLSSHVLISVVSKKLVLFAL